MHHTKVVVGVAIHNFMDATERINPDNPRFHAQLAHVYEVLQQAVLRRVHNIPPDGESKLDQRNIERGTHSSPLRCTSEFIHPDALACTRGSAGGRRLYALGICK